MSINAIHIRPAVEADRQRILAISSQVWDGTDYVPHILDYWLSGQNGTLFVCLLDNAVMGFARMTYLDADRAWLEGIRVDKQARGHGLGKAMTEMLTEKSEALGFKECLLSSYLENYESLAIVRAKGYQTLGTFKFFVANQEVMDQVLLGEILSGSTGLLGRRVAKYDIRFLGREELQMLLHRIDESFSAQKRLAYMSFDWTFEPFRQDLLNALIDEKALWELRLEFDDGETVDTLFSLSKRHSKDGNRHVNYIEKTMLSPWVWLAALELCQREGQQTFSYMAPTVNSKELASLKEVAKVLGVEVFNPEDEDVFLFSRKGSDGK